MNKPRVFIVEDQNMMRRDLVSMIEENGYEVAGSTMSGEEALDQIPRAEPDVVLLDIRLDEHGGGKIDGIQVAKELEETFPVPVIFLTSLSDLSLLRRLPRNYAGFLNKPIARLELIAMIEKVLDNDEPLQAPEAESFIFLRQETDNNNRRQIRVEVNNILFIEGQGKTLTLHLETGSPITEKSTLLDFERQFNIPKLIRINKYQIVNKSKLTAFEPPQTLMIEDQPFYIGKSYMKTVKERLPIFKSR